MDGDTSVTPMSLLVLLFKGILPTYFSLLSLLFVYLFI